MCVCMYYVSIFTQVVTANNVVLQGRKCGYESTGLHVIASANV